MHDLKTSQYIQYINNHILNIKNVWDEIQQYLNGKYWLDDYAWHTIGNNIKVHDASKFDNCEFEGYRQFFYPTESESPNKDIFDKAWLRHIHKNPHHWEHWLLYDEGKLKTLSIPFVYLFEMMCDWTAMSIKFNNAPSEWYNKQEILISKEDKESIQNWMPLFDRVFENITIKLNNKGE